MPLRGSPSEQPAAHASPHLGGVPFNRDVIEGTQRAESSDGGRFSMFRGRRQTFPKAGIPAGRETNQPAVDARSLGARPGSSLMRSIWGDNPSGETRSPSESSISRSRNLQGSNGVQSHPFKDVNSPQERFARTENGLPRGPPQERSARYTGTQGAEIAGQPSQTRFLRDHASFQPRNPSGERRPPQSGRSRASRSQASRDSDDSEPRRRKRGAEAGFSRGDRSGPAQKVWTEEEQQYLKEKAERESPQSLIYEPTKLSKETFTGMGPATASDEWGMSEMLGERLLLAKKYLDQEFIQWDSKEQKADVMAVVEKLKAIRRAKPTDGDEKEAKENTSVSADGDQQAQALMQKLVGGSYEKFKKLGEKDIVGHVERYVHRNDSYYPNDEKSLLEKVRTILPAEQASKASRSVKK